MQPVVSRYTDWTTTVPGSNFDQDTPTTLPEFLFSVVISSHFSRISGYYFRLGNDH
jgi:hypothetical protein